MELDYKLCKIALRAHVNIQNSTGAIHDANYLIYEQAMYLLFQDFKEYDIDVDIKLEWDKEYTKLKKSISIVKSEVIGNGLLRKVAKKVNAMTLRDNVMPKHTNVTNQLVCKNFGAFRTYKNYHRMRECVKKRIAFDLQGIIYKIEKQKTQQDF